MYERTCGERRTEDSANSSEISVSAWTQAIRTAGGYVQKGFIPVTRFNRLIDPAPGVADEPLPGTCSNERGRGLCPAPVSPNRPNVPPPWGCLAAVPGRYEGGTMVVLPSAPER